ncbi:DUF3575 domain-containing protein [Pedobacter mucosus]|uniref:DUF3575 domain-containing protein n=1 Tax=Pedobacter mucosus TaxID=2895286 RepID=UPI001EE41168|nr:DUF3575 domain-containing protein [Pedobacter mucosus]UKT65675.1 DUF3575 domain-containing protein [Pedobacter mucosus]
MRIALICVCLFIANNAVFAQRQDDIIVKSNLLNLIAKRPSFSLEKNFSQQYGLELSYTFGEYKNLPFRDYYQYNGFLLRAKKYFKPIETKQINPFYGIYIGNLNKTVVSHGTVDNTGFVSIGSNNNFNANSIRYGGTLGLLYVPKRHFVLEALTGAGYGNYFNVDNKLNTEPPKGYFDIHFWLSVGYRF